jgi:DNA-directed RNA polymerase subunit N (RpoN/RPB10)
VVRRAKNSIGVFALVVFAMKPKIFRQNSKVMMMSETQKRLVEVSYCDNTCASCGKSISEQDTEYIQVLDDDVEHKEAFCFACAEVIKEDM